METSLKTYEEAEYLHDLSHVIMECQKDKKAVNALAKDVIAVGIRLKRLSDEE